MWEEKEEGSNDESSYSKHKIRVTQVSNIKQNIQGTHHPLIRVGRKKRGGNFESSHSKHKIKWKQVSIIKENIQGTHHSLIRVERRKKRGVLMITANQNTKYK